MTTVPAGRRNTTGVIPFLRRAVKGGREVGGHAGFSLLTIYTTRFLERTVARAVVSIRIIDMLAYGIQQIVFTGSIITGGRRPPRLTSSLIPRAKARAPQQKHNEPE